MSSTAQLSAQTLGQIALIQGMVSHLPDGKSILSFVCRGLEAVPGVQQVTYRLMDRAIHEDEQPSEAPAFGCFRLKFGGMIFGELFCGVRDPALFTPYIPYLENLSLMLGVIFEERRQRRLNEVYQIELEQRVSERTRQLQAEIEEHRRSRLLLDAIINNARNVIYVKDLAGRFKLINRAFCEIFQLDRSKVIGRRPSDLFPAHIAKQQLANDQTVAAQKEPVTFHEQAELADGQHEYLSIKFPLLDDAGAVAAVGGISTDITDMKTVENALRLDEARLEALLELFQMSDAGMTDITDYALGEAIKLTKSEIGYLAFASADESTLTMYSWSPGALKPGADENKPVEFKVSEAGVLGEAVRRRAPFMANGYPALPAELKKGYPEGHVALIRHLNIPVFEGGRIVAVAGVGNKAQDYDDADVRQLRLLMQGMWRLLQRMRADEEKDQLQRRLQQASKMEAIGTLAGGIAHDFNNILSAIFGYTELSLSECAPGSCLHDNLINTLEAAKRARDLVGHILAFSRQSEHELMPVDVLPIAREVGKFMRATLPASIEIRLRLKDSPTVMADPTQIHQVVMNLCTNAGQAMSARGGVLGIELETVAIDADFAHRHPGLTPGAHVKLTISDTGHGIPADLIERIFDPFFTTKQRGKGTGMGLAVVHGIVKSYGGVVTVLSHPGEGTVFNVFLPTVERRSVQAVRPEKAVPRGNERILFVDDEESLATLGKTMLGSLGYQVTATCSSVEALSLFRNDPDQFDLIITDLTMPKISGDQLALECMKIRPDIPVVLCTGYSAAIDQTTAMAMGIRAFVNKPVLLRQISETIREVLDGPPKSRQN
ncbi:MAG: ATP-binding protein [Desulfobacteraceae bacterium]|nr:ATP-binding protein [Desulfobacteraceae bacterium]